MNDFEPGDIIYFRSEHKQLNNTGPYIVLNPVRTSKGKLRLKGPRGGYMTTWWTKDQIYTKHYKIEINGKSHEKADS